MYIYLNSAKDYVEIKWQIGFQCHWCLKNKNSKIHGYSVSYIPFHRIFVRSVLYRAKINYNLRHPASAISALQIFGSIPVVIVLNVYINRLNAAYIRTRPEET